MLVKRKETCAHSKVVMCERLAGHVASSFTCVSQSGHDHLFAPSITWNCKRGGGTQNNETTQATRVCASVYISVWRCSSFSSVLLPVLFVKQSFMQVGACGDAEFTFQGPGNVCIGKTCLLRPGRSFSYPFARAIFTFQGPENDYRKNSFVETRLKLLVSLFFVIYCRLARATKRLYRKD